MTVIQEISVPQGSLTKPRSLFKSVVAKLFMGSRFALGLVVFLVGVMIVVMLAKRAGAPTGAIERVVS